MGSKAKRGSKIKPQSQSLENRVFEVLKREDNGANLMYVCERKGKKGYALHERGEGFASFDAINGCLLCNSLTW